MIRFTKQYLSRLEDLFSESDYILRYEKGNFKSGYCVLKDQKVVIVNKYYPLEGKVNCLVDILRTNQVDIGRLKESNKKFYLELTQTELSL